MRPLNPQTPAVVVMHAWDCGTYEQFPGWHRAVEYIPRANKIAKDVFKKLLPKVRNGSMKVFHITNGAEYAKKYKGYKSGVEICDKHSAKLPVTKLPHPENDDIYLNLIQYKNDNSFPGAHNLDDIQRGKAVTDFPVYARPVGNEPIVCNGEELHAVCLEYGINHLVYVGFAINWCLQHAAGNMNEMHNRGFLCSAIRQAVTAVENKESARKESNKEHGLWVTAVQNGFVYDLDDFMTMLDKINPI